MRKNLKILEKRRWQGKAKDFLTSLYKRGATHGYVQAPPGSGKTILMAQFGDSLEDEGTRVIVVGKAKLVRQHHDRFRNDLGFTPLFEEDERSVLKSPAGHLWIVETWQAMARAEQTGSGKFDFDKTVLLYLDECHIGGSNDDNVSFKRVVSLLNPKFKVYVSATSGIVSESLLGRRKGHTFLYTMSEAYKDGILHPVVLAEYHTGTRATIERIQKVEAVTKSNMAQLQELDREHLAKLASDLRYLKVDVAGMVNKIVTHRFRSMISVYFEAHLGEHAIFFCPNIDAANAAVDWFNLRANKARKHSFKSFDGKQYPFRAFAAHTGVAAHKDIIDSFEQGKIPVLFVVGMLREGFDMDRLRLAFDCSFYTKWNKNRIAALLQKIGRLTRKTPDKQTSLYYFARDLLHFYRNKVLHPKHPDLGDVEDDIKDEADETEELVDEANDADETEELVDEADDVDSTDAEVESTANVITSTIIAVADGADEGDKLGFVEVPPTTVETLEVEDSERPTDDDIDVSPLKVKVRIAKTALYHFKLRGVRDHRPVNRYSVAEMCGVTAQEAEALLDEILDDEA